MDLLSRQVLIAAAGAAEVGNPWDLAYASFTGTPKNWFDLSAQNGFPLGLSFKSDGTKMYAIGLSSDRVDEYDLATPWQVGSASYVQGFSYLAQSTNVTDIFFKDDGSKFYLVDTFYDFIREYSLSTNWDVSTASYDQAFSISAQEGGPSAVFFKSDGTKMYVIGVVGDSVYEYDLSTAWDVSTASYLQSFSVATQDTSPSGLFFKSDGSVMYVLGDSGNDVNEYNLSTAWDVSTASYVRNFYVGTQEGSPSGLFFKSDGTQMYITGSSSDAIWQYSLSTAWDISTASFVYPSTNYFSVSSQENFPTGLFLKGDGTKMYVIGATGDDVNEYNLSTAWAVSTASYVQSFSVATQDTSPSDLFFKSDGTKMYVIGNIGDAVYEYDLSTAWDVSTASYLQNFSVAAQETSPYGLFLKSDGTKMYIIGSAADSVIEYSLSSAWDVSSASYVQSFSVAARNNAPVNIFFKDDGMKMYVVDPQFDRIDQYNLSTAWDISTASFDLDFSVKPEEGNPRGIFFKPDGTRFFVMGTNSDAVWAYDFS